MQWYFLIFSYYLTISNGHSLTALKSEEFTLISGSFKWGRGIIISFPYIFLLFDCFKWVLIDCIIKCRLHSMLWQFRMGGSICLWYLHVFSMHWYFLISSIILPLVSTCLLYVLLFPYIFLLFNCFEWALIDHIEKCRGHSALWQFQMGGSITYIFLLFDCFKWALIDCIEKRRGHSALWQFQMGGRGVNRQIYPKSANFELTCRFMLCFTEVLFVLHTKDLIITSHVLQIHSNLGDIFHSR